MTGPAILHAGLASSGETENLEQTLLQFCEVFDKWLTWALAQGVHRRTRPATQPSSLSHRGCRTRSRARRNAAVRRPASAQRAKPSGVLGPVLIPPWNLHLPPRSSFLLWHGWPRRLRAPQTGFASFGEASRSTRQACRRASRILRRDFAASLLAWAAASAVASTCSSHSMMRGRACALAAGNRTSSGSASALTTARSETPDDLSTPCEQ